MYFKALNHQKRIPTQGVSKLCLCIQILRPFSPLNDKNER